MKRAAKPRKAWIDFLRGIAMLLVIWGHIAETEYPFFLITSPFKLPLFFAITGYLFNERNGDVKGFFKNLLIKIIVPWLILSLVWLQIIYALVTGHPGNIGSYLYSVFSGQRFWFMPCCIIAEIIHFFVRKFFKREYARYIAMAIIAVAGLVFSYAGTGQFALFDVACTAQFFMMFGLCFRKNEKLFRKKLNIQHILVLCSVYVLLLIISVFIYPGKAIDVHHNDYYNLIICALLTLISLTILFRIASSLKRIPRWIVFVGQNTLVFYILHSYARSVLAKGLNTLHIHLPAGEPGYVITMIYVCIVMSIAALILNRFFPFAVGKRRLN